MTDTFGRIRSPNVLSIPILVPPQFVPRFLFRPHDLASFLTALFLGRFSLHGSPHSSHFLPLISRATTFAGKIMRVFAKLACIPQLYAVLFHPVLTAFFFLAYRFAPLSREWLLSGACLRSLWQATRHCLLQPNHRAFKGGIFTLSLQSTNILFFAASLLSLEACHHFVVLELISSGKQDCCMNW